MTPTELDDPLLARVRDARPAPPARVADAPATVQARIEGCLAAPASSTRRGAFRRRVGAALVPALGTAVALTVAAAAILGTAPRHRPQASGGARGPHLSARQYAVALGFGTVVPGLGSDAATRQLFDAEQVLRARCMSARGLGYRIERAPAAGRLPSFTGYPTTFYPNPSGSTYPEAALLAVRARDGFGIYRDVTAPRGDPDPEDHYVAALPPPVRARWESAWRGPHGCLSLAAASLYGSRTATAIAQSLPTLSYDYLNSAAYTQSGALSGADRRTAAAAAAWSRCVRAQTGRTFTDEDGLVTWLIGSTRPADQRSPAFRAREIRYALLSTRCAYRVGQPQTFSAAFRAAADHLPGTILAHLRFVIAHQPAWIARARTVLAGRRPGA